MASYTEDGKRLATVEQRYVVDPIHGKVAMEHVAIKVKILDMTPLEARPPIKGSTKAVGWDLFACGTYEILPWSRQLIHTGIAVTPPDGYYCQVMPRSGLAIKGIDIGAGVIDPDYRGEVGVLMINNSPTAYNVGHHDRVAQLVPLSYMPQDLYMLVKDLDATDRGTNGYGSTGI